MKYFMNTFEYICIALSTRQFREIGMPKKPHQDAALIVGINVREMHPHRIFHRRSTAGGTFGQNSQKLH